MWSIVQSPPVNSAPHCEQIGSKTVFANSRAFFHSLLLCQSAICFYSNILCTEHFRKLCDVSDYRLDTSSLSAFLSSYPIHIIKANRARSISQGLICIISSTKKCGTAIRNIRARTARTILINSYFLCVFVSYSTCTDPVKCFLLSNSKQTMPGVDSLPLFNLHQLDPVSIVLA